MPGIVSGAGRPCVVIFREMDGAVCGKIDGKVILLTGGIGSGKSAVRRILEGMGVPCYDADSAVKSFYATPVESLAVAPEGRTSEGPSSGNRPAVPGADAEDGEASEALAAGNPRKKPFLLPEVEKAFGRSFRLPDGEFDRRALASAIFGDPVKLKTVEDIVFPALAADFDAWRREAVSAMQSRRAGLADESSDESSDESRGTSGEADRTGFSVLSPFLIFESATALDKPDFPKIWDRCIWVDAPEQLRIERVTARDRCSREQVLSRIRLQPPLEAHRQEVDAVILNDCPLPELASRVRSAVGQL